MFRAYLLLCMSLRVCVVCVVFRERGREGRAGLLDKRSLRWPTPREVVDDSKLLDTNGKGVTVRRG